MNLCLLEMPAFKPGDKPPSGYLEWHEWADIQRKAGIRQAPCSGCGKWITPQEQEDHQHAALAAASDHENH